MSTRNPPVPKDYKKLPPLEKLRVLFGVMDAQAMRCDENVLLRKTWVQESFWGTADRLREIYAELKDKPPQDAA